MKNSKLLIMLAAVLSTLWACGGDDSTDPISVNSYTSPKVVSISPADGATGVAIGVINMVVTYDQKIIATPSESQKIVMTSGHPLYMSAADKQLTIQLDCWEYETRVTVTLPKGLIKSVHGVESEETTVSFTTEEDPDKYNNSISTTPSTNANEEAYRLYTFLYNQYKIATVSSVMANVNWNNTIAERIHTDTGIYPAMNCYDFIHIHVPDGNGWIDYSDITPVKQWADAGGLVQLMWHFNVPTSENDVPNSSGNGVTYKPSETTFQAKNALVEGTWEHLWFYQQMGRVADVILKLQEAGIAATWRPFHEAAGNATALQQSEWTTAWFWWGADGAQTYKELWHAMYNYFQQRGIRNLLWVWTTQNYNGRNDYYAQDTDWYPGDEYVDIIARDMYGSTVDENVQEFREISRTYPTKMVALGECGKNGTVLNDFADIEEAFTAGAKWGYFMGWYGDVLPSNNWWNKALNSPYVITREQVIERY